MSLSRCAVARRSISMGFGVSPSDTGYGYGLNVAKMLGGPYPQFYSKQLAGGLCTVQHSGGSFGANGGSSTNGAACIDKWLGGLHWDVVTVNFGLHDCQPGSLHETSPADYAKNLEVILTKARANASRVVFVTTTPFHQYPTYSMPCVIRYNALARQTVAKLNALPGSTTIAIAELFGRIESFCGANYTSCPIQLNNNLHFSTAWSPPYSVDRVTQGPLQSGPAPSGQQFTGLVIAQAIQRLLPAAKILPPINLSTPLPPVPGVWSEGGGGPCGLPPRPLNRTLPNVLIIGDSVSASGSGYGPSVRRLLQTSTGNGNAVGNNPRNDGPLASVQHNGGWSCTAAPFPDFPDCQKGANEQAGPTTTGIQCIDSWLGSEKWDIISFK